MNVNLLSTVDLSCSVVVLAKKTIPMKLFKQKKSNWGDGLKVKGLYPKQFNLRF